MSASKRFGAAKRFAIKHNHPLMITIKTFRRGKDVEPLARLLFPEYKRQRVVLFSNPVKVKIRAKTKVDVNGRQWYMLDLEETE